MNVLAKNYLQTLRTYQGNRYSSSTIENTEAQAIRFLSQIGAKEEYTRDDILRFVNAMVQQGYRRRSINTILTNVRRLFHANSLKWPVDRRDLYLGQDESEPTTPVLSDDDIAKIISGAKGARFPDLQLTMLSTIYGFRNTELARIISAGCNGIALEVKTAKHGRTRNHKIHPELSKALTFKAHEMGTDAVHKAFDRIMTRYNRKPQTREGWHSVRRSLATGLARQGVTEYTIFWFFGWHKNSMPFVYFHPQAKDIDREVYQLHPFLPLWLQT